MRRAALARLDRRAFLKGAVAWAGAVVLVSQGCGYYSPEEGAAYALWDEAFASGDPQRGAVHAATLASSPHNTQPWLFVLGDGWTEIFVEEDEARWLGAMDPLGRERVIGLGCAVENFLVAAQSLGLDAALTWSPDPSRPALVARIEHEPATPRPHALFPAIRARKTHRGRYLEAKVPARTRASLDALLAQSPRVGVRWVVTAEERAAFRAGTLAATQAIIDDEEMLAASDRWMRFTSEEIEAHRDGVTLDAQSLGSLRGFLAKTSDPVTGREGAAYWYDATEQVHTTTLSAFLLLHTGALEEAEDLLETGRLYQRLQLWLTAHGMVAQPLNQLAERRDRELQQALTERPATDLLETFTGGRHAQMLCRIGFALDETHHSPRRALDAVMRRAEEG